MRQPISRNPTQDVAPMTAIRPNDRSLLARTPVDPTLSSCVPHSAIAATAPGEGSSSDEDAAPTGAAILIEHYTLWPPLHCGEEPAAPRFPPRPLGDASRPIVAADSPNADGVGTVMLPVFDPEEARARLLELGVDDDLEEDLFDGATLPAKITSLGAEESRRAKLLSRLAQDSQTVAVQRLSAMRFESRRSVRLRRRLPTSKAPCSRWRMRLRSQLGQGDPPASRRCCCWGRPASARPMSPSASQPPSECHTGCCP